jgi:hypothetical protein
VLASKEGAGGRKTTLLYPIFDQSMTVMTRNKLLCLRQVNLELRGKVWFIACFASLCSR